MPSLAKRLTAATSCACASSLWSSSWFPCHPCLALASACGRIAQSTHCKGLWLVLKRVHTMPQSDVLHHSAGLQAFASVCRGRLDVEILAARLAQRDLNGLCVNLPLLAASVSKGSGQVLYEVSVLLGCVAEHVLEDAGCIFHGEVRRLVGRSIMSLAFAVSSACYQHGVEWNMLAMVNLHYQQAPHEHLHFCIHDNTHHPHH